MTTLALPGWKTRASNFFAEKLQLDAPPTPEYEELPAETIRDMWDAVGPKKQEEALTGLEAAYSYRERSSSNTLVMKGLVFGGFFALLAVQLSIGLAVTNPLFLVGAIYTCIGAWCVAMAFRPTPSQLKPKYTEDERKVKLQDGAFA